MIRAESLAELAAGGGAAVRGGVVSIGNFDGVHLGHRALLRRMREVADAAGHPTVVLTFFPPAKVLFGDATYLSGPEEKLDLIAEFEPTAVALTPFTHAFARTDKDAFTAQLGQLEPAAIVVGEDFRFGRDRSGGIDDLRGVAERVDVFGLETHGGEPVKSSRIRALLTAGDIDAANTLLGRPYRATGVVVRGQQRGATIGVPTANIEVPERKALPRGVFAVRIRRPAGPSGADEAWDGMANVGPRPTFEEAPPAIEAHLFDFKGDLYGETLDVRFHAHLRGQRKFAGIEDLEAQLRADAAAAREALAAAPSD